MNREKAQTILGIVAILFGVVSFSVGKLIIAFIGIVTGIAIIVVGRGTGSYNDRNQNSKIIKNKEVSIPELYEFFKDMDTHLGKVWLAEHKNFPGKTLVWGPSPFGDLVYVSKDGSKGLDIKLVSSAVNLKCDEKDAWRLENIIDATTIEVTPKNYSLFGSYKLVSTVFLNDLVDLIEKYIADKSYKAPTEINKFECYMHNSKDGYLRDKDFNDLCRVEKTIKPFDVSLIDEEGSVLAQIVTTKEDVKDLSSASFEMYADGKHYASIKHNNLTASSDTYIVTTDDGEEFVAACFMAVRRANVSANYEITKDGKRMAVVGGSPKLEFEGIGYSQNDIICSMNDDYLILFAAIQIFLMTANSYLR